ncbi:hypothetical protein ABT115_20415 [Streptomyces sp. NPDC001832]|uniref:hypothetical protein n=1 Tax=Streptomyces sp. NPDC001832 TaxID=3154527 RepID=UPI0033323285
MNCRRPLELYSLWSRIRSIFLGVLSATDADRAAVRVFQDGKLVKETDYPSLSGLPVGAGPAAYRITMDTSRPAWFPLSTKTSTVWTFKSARPSSGMENLALLWPKYGLDLGAENTTQGGSAYDFDSAFALQAGVTADIADVEVEVSTDDGATWSPAMVKTKSDGHYTVFVRLRRHRRNSPGSRHTATRHRSETTKTSLWDSFR